MKLAKIVAINVNSRLDAIDMTKKQLASLTNVSRNTIDHLTSGKSKMVRYETLEQVARAMRCKPNQLFDEDTNWSIFKWADTYKKAGVSSGNQDN